MIKGLRHRVADALKYRIEWLMDADSRNIERELQRRARSTTIDLIESSFGSAKMVRSQQAVLNYALNEVARKQPGLYLEFGVYQGTTINLIASTTNDTVHGFDSFEGLPEDWRADFDKGTFKVPELPSVLPNVILHKGWFSETLPGFLEKYSGAVSFLHVDCDLYSSTKTVFSALADRLIPGMVIVFDEYFNYPGWQEGEYKAFMEFIATGRRFEYLAYNCRWEQVAVRLL
jgi:predicted O-methyltransferase YrrM